MVDLAGSERQTAAQSEGQRLKEAGQINKSLSTLALVIRKLSDGSSAHVPFRDSKLTLLLKESIGGSSRTAVIVAIHPDLEQERETLSTLAFADNVKKIKNKTAVNKIISGESVAALKERIIVLERLLDQEKASVRRAEHRVNELEARSVENLENIEPAKKRRKTTMHEMRLWETDEKENLADEEKKMLEQKIAELEVRKKEAENDDLRKKVVVEVAEKKELEQMIRQLQENIKEKAALALRLEEKLEDSQRREKEADAFEERIIALEKLLEHERASVRRAEERVTELEALKEKVLALEEHVKAKAAENEELRKKVDEERSEVERMICIIEENKERMTELEARSDENLPPFPTKESEDPRKVGMDEEYSKMKEKIAELEDEIQQRDFLVARLQEKIGGLQKRGAEKLSMDLEYAEKRDRERRIRQLADNIERQEAIIKRLGDSLRKANCLGRETEERLRSRGVLVEDLRKKLREKQETIEKLTRGIGERNAGREEDREEQEEEAQVDGGEAEAADEDPALLKKAASPSKNSPSAKTKRGGKKAKDPNAPKRAMTAFFFWLKENRDRIKESNPHMSVTDVSRAAGAEWGNLADKKKWENQAAEDKKRYEVAMGDYKRSQE